MSIDAEKLSSLVSLLNNSVTPVAKTWTISTSGVPTRTLRFLRPPPITTTRAASTASPLDICQKVKIFLFDLYHNDTCCLPLESEHLRSWLMTLAVSCRPNASHPVLSPLHSACQPGARGPLCSEPALWLVDLLWPGLASPDSASSSATANALQDRPCAIALKLQLLCYEGWRGRHKQVGLRGISPREVYFLGPRNEVTNIHCDLASTYRGHAEPLSSTF